MTKDQILNFKEKWGIPTIILAKKMGIGPKVLAHKFKNEKGNRITDANLEKLNDIINEMRDDLAV